jgi:uncharacterized protein YbjT (DUF2867 family)
MRVLLTGQGGFIGSRLRTALLGRGHLVPALRVDFRQAVDAAAWAAHLDGIDVVINTAGIFKERRRGDLDLVNRVAPCALFRAAAIARVRLVIQFSALGADARAASRFHLGKRAADQCLREQAVAGVSLQPSLVFGAGGASATLMTMLATLPLVPLPGDGNQRIQPIHVDDVVAAVVALVEGQRSVAGLPAAGQRVAAQSVAGQSAARLTRDEAPDGRRSDIIALVGPRPLALRDYLADLRSSLQLAPARFVAVPKPLMRLVARLAALLPAAPVDADALAMLDRGNVADAVATTGLLGRPPRDPTQFIAADQVPAFRTQAALGWLLPVLRITIAVMWFWAGIVSIWFHPVADSYRMLTHAGVPATLAPLALYGAAATDILLGALTLALPRHKLLWQIQILLVLVYTAIIAFRLPEFLSHPFGPIVKNLPILAALLLLAELTPPRRRWH